MPLLFILLNLLMLFAAHLAAYRYLRQSGLSEQIVAAFLIVASQITLTILFLGIVIKNLAAPWILLLNSVISLAVIFLLRRTIRESIVRTHEKWLKFSNDTLKAKDFFLYLFILLFAAQVVLTLIKIYYLPPHVWDVFSYHLHPVAEWLQQNMIPSTINSPVTRMNRNPLGIKILHLWSFKFSNDIRWIELPQFIFGLLVPLCAYSIMRKIDVSKTNALKYAILIYFIPLILLESRTCQDHLALNSALLMTVLFLINVCYEKKYSHIIFVSLACGLMLGAKISAPQVIAVLFAALLFTWRPGFDRTRLYGFLKQNGIRLAVGAALAMAMGAYWYLKNLAILKAYKVMGSRVLSLEVILPVLALTGLAIILRKGLNKYRSNRVATKTASNTSRKKKIIIAAALIVIIAAASWLALIHADLIENVILADQSPHNIIASRSLYQRYPILGTLEGPFIKNLLALPFRLKDVGLYTSYTPDFLAKSGFGVQFFGFGLLAYLIMTALMIKRKYRQGIAGFTWMFSVLLLLSYFFYYYTAANYRLFMFFPVFGIILWAFLLAKFQLNSHYLKIIDILLLVMLVFNGAVCLFEGNMHKNRWKTLLTITNPQERTSIKYSHLLNGSDWEFIDRFVLPGESIAYMGYSDSWVFPYFDNRLRRRIYRLKSLPGFRGKKISDDTIRIEFTPRLKKSLKNRHIRFIHINIRGAASRKAKLKKIIINDKDLYRISKYLYYYKWT